MKNVLKSEFPYLVDIAITTNCMNNCPYCYANAVKSMNGGENADWYFLSHQLPIILMKSNVFEVVLGGGEPTIWIGNQNQKLSYILKSFRERKFKISLTTKNYKWYKDPDFDKAIQQVHSVAISINSKEDLKAARNLMKQVPRVNLQVILGVIPMDLLEQLLKDKTFKYKISCINILGYKYVGRGLTYTPQQVDTEWINWAKTSQTSVGVDSVIVSKYYDALLEAGVSNFLMCGEEGKQTCFIDAVHKTMAKSSFDGEPVDISKLPYNREHEKFLEIFQTF